MDYVRAIILLFVASVASAQTYYNKTAVSPQAVYDVKSYGAVCNGSTNDTAAFARAATAVSAAGGTLFIPSGSNCVIANTTTIGSATKAVTISGYGATLTPISPRASWAGTVNNQAFVLAASAKHVTIQGITFAYDSTYNSGACHVIDIPSTASRVLIKDNTSTYCGDFVANIGGSDVTITNNRAYTVYNACYDNWNGAANIIVTNNICSVSGSGSRAIEFTGLTTALTAANSSNVIITGNIITLLGSAEQGINVDGLTSSCAGNASEKYGTIADNHIFMAPSTSGWGILLRFCANYWDVHNNVIFSDGTDMAVAAIAANSDSNAVNIHHNIVYNWNNQTSGSERGLFRNGSVGGTLIFNECYSCTTATALIGATDSTTLVFGNDTGTGAISATLGTLTLNPGTSISQATWGTAGIEFVGKTGTFNDTTTGSGGVNTDVAYGFDGPTFTNTQGTANILTNAVTARFAPPICGTGWASCSNLYAISATGRVGFVLGMDVAGASINLNTSNNFGVNINTGTSSGTTTVGNSLSTFALNAATVNGSSWALLPALTATSLTTTAAITAGTKFVHGVTVICSSASAAATSHTSDTSEFNLATCTLPANLVPAGSMLRVTAIWLRTATTTNTVTFTLRDSATQNTTSAGNAYSNAVSTSGTVSVDSVWEMYAPTTTSQLVAISGGSQIAGNSANAPATGTQDRTAASYLNFNCKNTTSSSDTCGLYAYTVELLAP